jgi:hypothetical protein
MLPPIAANRYARLRSRTREMRANSAHVRIQRSIPGCLNTTYRSLLSFSQRTRYAVLAARKRGRCEQTALTPIKATSFGVALILRSLRCSTLSQRTYYAGFAARNEDGELTMRFLINCETTYSKIVDTIFLP